MALDLAKRSSNVNTAMLWVLCGSAMVLALMKWPAAQRYALARYQMELPALNVALPGNLEEVSAGLRQFSNPLLQRGDRAVVFGLQEALADEISRQQAATAQQAQRLLQTQATLAQLRTQAAALAAATKQGKNKKVAGNDVEGKSAAAPPLALSAPTPFKADYAQSTKLPITSGDRVLFVGDSLMQGVAPHAIAALRRQAPNVFTLDLSRQSTGLAYPNFFDWPRTAANAIAQHRIGLMVVFVGANDFYDMATGGKRLTVGSPQWQVEYAAVVQNMVVAAHSQGVRVVWMEMPPMNKAVLSEKMTYLNAAFAAGVGVAKGRYVPTYGVLADENGRYAKFLPNAKGVPVQLRLDDGVHFTVEGQRRLAARLLAQFEVVP